MMSRKTIAMVFSCLLVLSALLGCLPPAFAQSNPSPEVHLFTPEQWQTLSAKSSSETGEQMLFKLNTYRDVIGREALKIIHTSDNVEYRQTDSVFASPRDGGGYVYGFIIHWFRNVALGIGKDLTTKIVWEVIDNQHYQARVFEDNSLFQPGNPEQLDQFFRNLIPSS